MACSCTALALLIRAIAAPLDWPLSAARERPKLLKTNDGDDLQCLTEQHGQAYDAECKYLVAADRWLGQAAAAASADPVICLVQCWAAQQQLLLTARQLVWICCILWTAEGSGDSAAIGRGIWLCDLQTTLHSVVKDAPQLHWGRCLKRATASALSVI